MKLRYQRNAFGPRINCIDEDDATSELVGQGDSIDEARRDYFDQWLNREALRDIKRGASAIVSWDNLMRQICGLQS